MAPLTLPPDLFSAAVGHRPGGQGRVLLRVPLSEQGVLAPLPAVVPQTLPQPYHPLPVSPAGAGGDKIDILS